MGRKRTPTTPKAKATGTRETSAQNAVEIVSPQTSSDQGVVSEVTGIVDCTQSVQQLGLEQTGRSDDEEHSPESTPLPSVSEFRKFQEYIKSSLCDIQTSLHQVITLQNDFMYRLSSVEQKQTTLINSLQVTDTELTHVKEKSTHNFNKMSVLEKQVELLSSENKQLKERVLNGERYSRDFNLRFGGIPETAGEDCIKLVNNVISKDLKLTNNIDIENAHRVGKRQEGKPRHIIVKFLLRPERKIVLFTSKTALKNNNMFITEDLILEDRIRKTQLRGLMDKLYKEGRKVRFSKGRLFVDGKDITGHENNL